MALYVKANASTFEPAPEGMAAAVCIDVVDMGMVESNYGGEKKLQHKVRIVWALEHRMKNGKPYIAQKRYTASLHKKANLRKDLETWRGKKFTESEIIRAGFDLEILLGIGANLFIQHDVKEDGTTFANVMSVLPLKGKPPAADAGYVRHKDRTGDGSNGTKPLPSQRHEKWADDDPPPHNDADAPPPHDDEEELGGVF